MSNRRDAEEELIANIHAHADNLNQIKEACDNQWGGEDYVYRFWHGSFKVYGLQELTQRIVGALAELCPEGGQLNPWFTGFVDAGTGKEFNLDHNRVWVETTRPIVDAYFHAYYMLGMVLKYGPEFTEAPGVLPSGWAAVLELYQIR